MKTQKLKIEPPLPEATPVRRWLLLLSFLAFSLTFVAGCAHCPLCGAPWASDRPLAPPKPPEMKTTTGTVSCMERVTILPTFEIRVRLISLCPSESERQVLAEQTIKGFSGFPLAFSLEYDRSKMVDFVTYGLVAELLSQGTPLYRTDTQYKITGNGPSEASDLVIVRIQ